MAFQPRDLSVLAYANGFTLWHYATPDAHTAVRVTGYFNPASHMMRLGDMVLANTGVGTTPVSGILLVNANSGGVIDTADLTVVGAADTD
ncbi:hypothetical protein [Niveispirillum cyanobacteriorum]|uniref:Uncharacterized protein n=1 Tax=Niveispirillum cyanobacteriorum TaxID=1612173 RepID=A0A2K9NBZ4_9PROT|nr:hypothetical protein [Niveispirillum cyanobacteriorum]AUN30634.1 hypothetical protein C0V82_10580 [Niveispirillum cyanobacteriorum]GGE52749.1 hypothetical protein GCM10011317_08760 [Niveispirillum cyanobacteriorum]